MWQSVSKVLGIAGEFSPAEGVAGNGTKAVTHLAKNSGNNNNSSSNNNYQEVNSSMYHHKRHSSKPPAKKDVKQQQQEDDDESEDSEEDEEASTRVVNSGQRVANLETRLQHLKNVFDKQITSLDELISELKQHNSDEANVRAVEITRSELLAQYTSDRLSLTRETSNYPWERPEKVKNSAPTIGHQLEMRRQQVASSSSTPAVPQIQQQQQQPRRLIANAAPKPPAPPVSPPPPLIIVEQPQPAPAFYPGPPPAFSSTLVDYGTGQPAPMSIPTSRTDA